MNRFFSKLDLRDIKIDPRTSRFLPDAEDELNEDADPGSVHQAQSAPEAHEPEPHQAHQPHQPHSAEHYANGEVAEPPAAQNERPRYVPSWAATPAPPSEPDLD